MNRWLAGYLAVTATACLFGLILIGLEVRRFGTMELISVDELESVLRPMTSTWVSGGITRTHTTPRLRPDEPIAELSSRHLAEMAYLLAPGVLPRDP